MRRRRPRSRCSIARTLVVVIAPLSVGIGASGQPPHFTARREAVRVDVLVTDRGQPLTGLGASDFEILDNDVAQTVDLVSYDEVPLNVVLAFDSSDSVAGERLDHLRKAGHALLDGLKEHDQAALVTFSHVVSQRSGLTGDRARVRGALDATPLPGDTALIDGLFTAMTIGESDAGRALVIAFSDGVDNSSWLTADAVLDAARRCDVVVYGVAVGRRPPFLRDVAQLTGGDVLHVESTRNLDAAFTRILNEFRHRYLVSYSPAGVSPSGWHHLKVRLKNRSATIKARPGYLRDAAKQGIRN